MSGKAFRFDPSIERPAGRSQPGGNAWLSRPPFGRIAKLTVDGLLVLALLVTGWRLVSVRAVTQPDEPSPAVRFPPLLDLGARLSTRIRPLENHDRAVVLMLDTRCPACQASRPFYRAVSQATIETPNIGFVVLVEESVNEARRWLAADAIAPDRIIKLRSRTQAGMFGTPTLILVDQTGVITDIANQALSSVDELRFIDRVRRPTSGLPLRIGYFLNETAAIDPDANAQVVDTRDRAAFQREHSTPARNIPRDELLSRGPAELLRALPTFVDCRHDDQRLCRIAAATLQDAKFTDVQILLK